MRKTNKKLLVSLSVLATPFVAENLIVNNVAKANATYNLTQNAKVYTNAQNAAKQVNSSKTYTSGTYYIYKEHNGMINISRTKGKPGAWINPATNSPVEVPVTKAPVEQTTTTALPVTKEEVKSTPQVPVVITQETTVSPKEVKTTEKVETQPKEALQTQEVKSNVYTLNNSVKTYSNASAAKTQKGSKSTYTSGNYFIFKEFNGMINISRVAGRAGAWINPIENKVIEAKATPVEKIAEIKAAPAEKKEEKPVTSNTEKKEEVKQEEKIVAPEAKKNEATTSNKVSPLQGDKYILKYTTNTYSNAVDASNSSNSKNTYGQGTYYVYRTHNGMVNISRTRGKAGAWINPNEKEVTVKGNENTLTVLPFANKNYKITSPYGVARNIASLGIRDVHNGVDFVTGNSKEAILATEDGVVTGAGYWKYDGSQYVTIKHSDNSYTSYWHLALNSITVKAGDKVKAGQKIGTIGSTGPSTGIHLHFMHSTTKEWWNSHQDPMKYLRSLSNKQK